MLWPQQGEENISSWSLKPGQVELKSRLSPGTSDYSGQGQELEQIVAESTKRKGQ